MWYFYRFEDGYTCWTRGKLPSYEKAAYKRGHGKIIEERRA